MTKKSKFAPVSKIKARIKNLMARRTHRSFYLTNRADSKRKLKIEGYVGFSAQVWRLLWQNKWLFTKFFLLYGLFSLIIIGLMSQESFANFREVISGEDGYQGISKWFSLFSNAVTGSSNSTNDASQQIMSVVLFLMGWLTMVWLLRAIMRGDGEKIKLRDGLYSFGAPILATFLVLLVILLQLLPFAVVLIAYVSVTAAGWINTGIAIENMAAWCALAVVAVLTLYWICSSILALIIVTLPGTYPFVAIRAAGDLVVGRRLKLVLRLLFMVLPVAFMWLLILMPAILIDSWLKLTWQPLVPIVVFALGIMTIIWCATYIYMLYRKIVDDPTPPVRPKKLSKKPPKIESVAAKNSKVKIKKSRKEK